MDEKYKCSDCAHMYCYNPKEMWVKCSCDDVKKDKVVFDNIFKTGIDAISLPKEECEYYMPFVEVEEEDIEVEYSFYISHKCPYCGNNNMTYSNENEGGEIIECDSCGKKYKIYYCLERF